MITGLPYKGREVVVLGLARSGRTAAASLAASGADVIAWDDSVKARKEFVAVPGVRMVDPALDEDRDWAAIVMSPGIPLSHPAPHPLAAAAKAAKIPVIGDIELLWQAGTGARFIGITGTNGKSTTTSLIHHIFAQAGQPVAVGGNLGMPVLDLPTLTPDGTYVIEMSSFQLDLIDQTRIGIAILLNITPDHLDRHGDMAGYVAAKKRIFRQQLPGDAAIIGIDDDYCRTVADEVEGTGLKVIRISAEHAVEGGVGIEAGQLIDGLNGQPETILDLSAIAALPGRHNWQNAAAAYAACRASGLSRDVILSGIASYPGLQHRQENVGRLGHISFVNDSKATNADAAAKALGCYDRIYWIAGGKSKDGGIDSLTPFFSHVVHAYLIGEAADEFAKTLAGQTPVTLSGTLEKAVAAAANDAAADSPKPATVLLSPACASFDQYPNFEIRGDHFRSLVQRILAEAA